MLQAQAGYDSAGIQPLPAPYTPGVATPESLGIVDDGNGWLFIGDSGGVTNPEPQLAVAAAMVAERQGPKPPICAVTVGDLDYYNGAPGGWVPQLLEPYEHFDAPIIGTGGNHEDDPTGAPPGSGMGTFMQMFCTKTPQAPFCDPEMEYGRHTETQPSHDFTLTLKAATLIGMWSNVVSGGYLFPNQIAWLTAQLKAADPSLPVLVYMHHPCYSVDAMHGGSASMGATLDGIFEASRWPDMVVAGHIHDQQSFLRQRPGGTTRYVVIGNSGYRNLHAISGDYVAGMDLGGGVTCEYAYADSWGYLKMTASGGKLSGQFVQVALDGTVTPAFEFSS
jgi:3',5'-cyclic AMP phosphodiesterase CpdA